MTSERAALSVVVLTKALPDIHHADWFLPSWHLESTYHVLCEFSLSGFVYLTK